MVQSEEKLERKLLGPAEVRVNVPYKGCLPFFLFQLKTSSPFEMTNHKIGLPQIAVISLYLCINQRLIQEIRSEDCCRNEISFYKPQFSMPLTISSLHPRGKYFGSARPRPGPVPDDWESAVSETDRTLLCWSSHTHGHKKANMLGRGK